MGKAFYIKLALGNLKRNQKKFIPYFIAATIMISVYFMVVMIINSPGLKDVPEHMALQQMFTIGFYTLNIFIAEFMLYINGFLIKQRKKELGLYGILGLEKRHVGYVMLWENLIINGAAVILGIISGCVFGWMIFMLLMKSVNVTMNSTFIIPAEAFLYTTIYFIILFLLISIINIFRIRMANPIDLLKSDHQGEKKKRFMLPTTMIGLTALGYAYYIALNVTNPLQALNKFFFAVVLVIFASYILFTSGSIVLLKLLKKNKKYYYQPDNFVSVAGMMHRMRQNANGLATICILSSMVLVTVSTCVALFLGQEDTLTIRNKDDIMIEVSKSATEEEFQKLYELIDNKSQEYQVEVEDKYHYFSLDTMLMYEQGQLQVPEKSVRNIRAAEHAVSAFFLPLEDFNRICSRSDTLQENELLILSNGEYEKVKDFTVGTGADQISYQIKAKIPNTVYTNGKNRKAKEEVYFVAKDREVIERLKASMNLEYMNATSKIILNINTSQENGYDFGKEIEASYGEIAEPLGMDNIYVNRAMCYSLYGGLLFLGAFFTILFLSATVLIIYFKQISEGYEDKERFETLQKVGMDDREVKRTINKQILIVFFLPLLGALLHVAMASNMIIRLLEVFWLYNVTLTVICIMSSCVIFTIAYIVVYRLTAVTYCRIVKW